MATHFRWYGSSTDTVVPANAVYTYPSQANKAVKSTPKLPPKNGSTFTPTSQPIRIEIPAMGYINGAKSTLAFDVSLQYTPVSGDASIIRFQNNIQSLFKRVQIMYGSTPIEDITEYCKLVRCLTEWTTTGDFDQGSIAEGIGHSAPSAGSLTVRNVTNFGGASGSNLYSSRQVNARQAYIHGISLQQSFGDDPNPGLAGDGFGIVPYTPSSNLVGANIANSSLTNTAAGVIKPITVTRRYVVQLQSGFLLCEKLIAAKYMASQVAIQITLAPPEECIYWLPGSKYEDGPTYTNAAQTAGGQPTYEISNVAFMPEVIEFDSNYDAAFIDGLNGGVPMLFQSWNTFLFSCQESSTQVLQIAERNRSLKSIFAIQCRQRGDYALDNGATFFCTNNYGTSFSTTDSDLVATTLKPGTLEEYQFRIGGKFIFIY
jgi:hypothetical protein